MSSKPKPNSMKVNGEHERLPKLRFRQFRQEPAWDVKVIGEYLAESRLPGSDGAAARKLTVKLWGKGVQEKNESVKGSENTQYYLRRAGQFIYSKLDFVHQAFGIIPPDLDGLESTVDLPCFDVSRGLNTHFLLEYVQRPSFYRRHGELADGGRKAKRIQAEAFLSFPILVPNNREEQEQIAECLISLDELIVAHDRKLDALRAYRRGLLRDLLPPEGEAVPLRRFPKFRQRMGWRTELVEAVANVTTGGKDTQDKDDDGLYPFFVRSQEVQRINSYSYEGEAVLTSGDGVGVGHDFHYVNGRFDFHQRVYCLYDFRSDVSARFFYLYFAERFGARVRRMSAKNSVDSVRRAMITEMPMAMPELDEQNAIADTVFELDRMIADQSALMSELALFRRALAQRLFPSAAEVKA